LPCSNRQPLQLMPKRGAVLSSAYLVGPALIKRFVWTAAPRRAISNASKGASHMFHDGDRACPAHAKAWEALSYGLRFRLRRSHPAFLRWGEGLDHELNALSYAASSAAATRGFCGRVRFTTPSPAARISSRDAFSWPLRLFLFCHVPLQHSATRESRLALAQRAVSV